MKRISKIFNRNIFKSYFILGCVISISLGLMLSTAIDQVNWYYFLSAVCIGFAIAFSFVYITKLLKREITYTQYRYTLPIMCGVALIGWNVPNYFLHLNFVLIHLLLILGIARIGCSNVGCCHGRLVCSGNRFFIGYLRKRSGLKSNYRVNTQLIETFSFTGLYIINIVLIIFSYESKFSFCFTVLGYAYIRFITEFFRGDFGRYYLLGLSEAQWISCVLAFITMLIAQELPQENGLTLFALAVLLTAILLIIWAFRHSGLSVFHYNNLILGIDSMMDELKSDLVLSRSLMEFGRLSVSRDKSGEVYISISSKSKRIRQGLLGKVSNALSNSGSSKTVINRKKNIAHIIIPVST